eukprot:13299827-Alexandrium_andersonii.AAC.1
MAPGHNDTTSQRSQLDTVAAAKRTTALRKIWARGHALLEPPTTINNNNISGQVWRTCLQHMAKKRVQVAV